MLFSKFTKNIGKNCSDWEENIKQNNKANELLHK